MKIIHCLFSMEIGGAQVLTVELLNEMCTKNDVALIIINNIWSTDLLSRLDSRVKIFHFNREKGNRSILPIIRLNILLFNLKADIIHCHEPNMVQIIKVKKPKLFHTVHDVGIDTRFYKLYDEIITISDAVYNDVSSRCLLPVKKIYNGIPISLFARRTDYTLDAHSTIRLVQVSRLIHEKKGQDILLYAMQKIVFEYGLINCHLDIIGTGNSYKYLNDLIKSLQLTNNVKLLGEKGRNWIICNLCNYHILVQPSRYEGFGLTIIEGIAAGLPVLASDIDGPAEIIANLPGGFLFKNEDVICCAKELCNIVMLYEKNKIEDIMNATTPLIEARYSMEICSDRYLAEYESANKQKT